MSRGERRRPLRDEEWAERGVHRRAHRRIKADRLRREADAEYREALTAIGPDGRFHTEVIA